MSSEEQMKSAEQRTRAALAREAGGDESLGDAFEWANDGGLTNDEKIAMRARLSDPLSSRDAIGELRARRAVSLGETMTAADYAALKRRALEGDQAARDAVSKIDPNRIR